MRSRKIKAVENFLSVGSGSKEEIMAFLNGDKEIFEPDEILLAKTWIPLLISFVALFVSMIVAVYK